MKNFVITTLLLFAVTTLMAQDELFNQLDSLKTEKSVTPYAFKALQVCNIQ